MLLITGLPITFSGLVRVLDRQAVYEIRLLYRESYNKSTLPYDEANWV